MISMRSSTNRLRPDLLPSCWRRRRAITSSSSNSNNHHQPRGRGLVSGTPPTQIDSIAYFVTTRRTSSTIPRVAAVSSRPFSSSLLHDHDDLNLPPLDLTTPSLSIPLPPNYFVQKQSKISSVIEKEVIEKKKSVISAVNVNITSESAIPSTFTSLASLAAGDNAVPKKVHKGAKEVGNSSSSGHSSFLSSGIDTMKDQLVKGGSRLSSKQRGMLRHSLQAKVKEKETFEHNGVLSNDTPLPVNREEELIIFKRQKIEEIDESFPRAENTPISTDKKQLARLAKLKSEQKKCEQAFLHGRDDPQYAKLYRLMQQIRLLEEFNVNPSQWKKIRSPKQPRRMQVLLEARRREFHAAEERTSSSNSNSSRTDSTAMQPDRGTTLDSPYIRLQQLQTQSVTKSIASNTAMHLSSSPQQSTHSLPLQEGRGANFPTPDFIKDLITTQANGTILGHSGSTSVLSTVVLNNSNEKDYTTLAANSNNQNNSSSSLENHKLLLSVIQQANAESGATFIPLQVDYRERFHASGKIPGNRRRRDNTGPLSDREVLASRVIDRTVRPWLMMGLASNSSSSLASVGGLPEDIVVNCQVQSYDPRPVFAEQQSNSGHRTHADPIALAINSTIAAMYQSAYSTPNSLFMLPVPNEAAACVKLAMMRDGSVLFDPTPEELGECKLELLYAATKDRVLMLEFSSNGGLPNSGEDPGVSEVSVASAFRLAHGAIIPIIEKQEELHDEYIKAKSGAIMSTEKNEALMTDEEVAKFLGFDSLMASMEKDRESVGPTITIQDGMKLVEEASSFVWDRAGSVALKLFGYDSEEEFATRALGSGTARVYDGTLLPKKVRGRRETVLQAEISRLLQHEFLPDDLQLATVYRSAIGEECNKSSECLVVLANHIHETTMKRAMRECAVKNLRSDGRGGRNVVRPISATAPVFPDSVHGSALFSRGETQVVCTATVGAPQEGLPISDPYILDKSNMSTKDERGDDENVPVGSLRFQKNQAALESDMNTRRVVAGREMTGESGILSEVKRAFLHYDFPDFSTGVVRSRAGASSNRRAIGHGNLAEKAVLPALPHVNDFPYTIRITSEVTSSNGSSSMASACGASLALLDAGVPLVSPVAGVSVGIAPSSKELMLDITGTEDHYGDMDFKVCGTYGGITAMQLDVKRPIPVETLLDALDLAKEGRRAILHAMANESGLQPRDSLKSTAPRVEVITFDPNRKRDLVGPGGTVLRQLEDRFDVSLDLSQEGRCLLYGPLSSVMQAKSVIQDLVSDVEEGGVYEGTVIEIKDFGAVVEILRNKEGLLHVSEITDSRERHPGGNLGLVKSHLKVGDKIEVLCTKIDQVQGSIKLSRRKLLQMRENKSLPNESNPFGTYVQSKEALNGADSGYTIPIPTISNMTQKIESQESKGIYGSAADSVCEEPFEELSVDSDQEESDDELSADMRDSYSEGEGLPGDMKQGSKTAPMKPLDARWMERYTELEQYKNSEGHCNIPQGSTEHPALANWVKQQRRLYKEGKLSDDRVQHLEDIGFEWVRGQKGAPWEQRYGELQQYKNSEGHCNIPQRSTEHPALANWVKRQRRSYREGKLSDDRVQHLEDIGFEWVRI